MYDRTSIKKKLKSVDQNVKILQLFVVIILVLNNINLLGHSFGD